MLSTSFFSPAAICIHKLSSVMQNVDPVFGSDMGGVNCFCLLDVFLDGYKAGMLNWPLVLCR